MSVSAKFLSLDQKRKFIRAGSAGPILESLIHPGATAFLFYPGTMIEPGHYALFLNHLYLAGFSVYGLHLAGHGRNSAAKVRTFEDMLDEGLKAQDWIYHNYGPAIVVGGHSQGGICALAHGALSDSPAAIFAFGACLPQLDESIQATRFANFARHRKKILNILKFLATFCPWLPIPLPVYLSGHKILANSKRPLVTGKGKTGYFYPVKFLYSFFSYNIPEKILCPTWIITARGDGVFTRAITEKSFATISAPKKTLLYLPAGGHLAILNPWLSRYAAALCACATMSLGHPLIVSPY